MNNRPSEADTYSGSTRAWGHLACALIALALTIPFYRVLLSGDLGPLHRDFGTIFLSKMQQQVDALRAGKLLFWDPILYCGTAFWPLPNTAPAYPPLLLSFLVRGSALGGLNLTILLHIFWGGLGTYWLVHSLTRRRFAALTAGLLFIFARYSHHLAFVLPLDFMALSWMPWTLYFLLRAQAGPRWISNSLVAALAYAPVAWVGGYNVFLYGLIVCGAVVMAGACRKPVAVNLLCGARLLALFFTAFLLLSAGRLLPTAAWLPLTSRGEPLPFNFAARGSFSLPEIVQWLLQEGWIPLALLVLGLYPGLLGRLKRYLPFALTLILIAVFSSGILFPFLHEYVPGFSRMREPRRAVLVTPAVVPVAVGLVLAWLQSLWRPGRWAGPAIGALFLGLLAFDVVGKSDYERPEMHSLSKRLEANAVHQDLVRRAQDEPRFRMHDFEDTRINLKRTADIIHSALGLESLEAVLGNISVNDYDRDYFGASAYDPARLWGLMNCRYVTSGKPLDVKGLHLIRKFPEDPEEIKNDSDGPYLYRNEKALPRAYLVNHAVLGLDTDPHNWRDWRALVFTKFWNPNTTALILCKPDHLRDLEDDFFKRFEFAFNLGADRSDSDRIQIIQNTVLQLYDFEKRMVLKGYPAEIFQKYPGMVIPHQPLPDPERGWNEAALSLPEDAGGKWLILAETYAIYPGWTAYVDGREIPLWTANGVATAVALPEGARRIEFKYRPPGWIPGMTITLLSLAIILLVIWKKGRNARSS